MKTTLNKLRQHNSCTFGWKQLLKHLRKTDYDDEPLSITTILDSNGLNDALWALRAVEGHDREIRLFAVWCARQVEHLMTDQRSRDALNVAERHASADATDAELKAARAAAKAAAKAAASDEAKAAAWVAAWDAAWAAAWIAAWTAAKAAAWAEAWDAAWDAAWAVAWDAARDKAMVAQARRLREVCAEIEARVGG